MPREMIVFTVKKPNKVPGINFFKIQDKYSEQDIQTKKILLEEVKL